MAKDFKEFIRLWQTTHAFCSPYHPKSNGKLERFHRTLKEDAVRPKTFLTLKDAKRIVGDFIDHYNTVRLHSALDTSPQPTASPDATPPSSPPETKNSKRPDSTVKSNVNNQPDS